MKNRPLVLILILYVALNLQACTSSPLRKSPKPTTTNTPTLAPTNTPTLVPTNTHTLVSTFTPTPIFEVIEAQAKEIAVSLSGDKAIECGSMIVDRFEPKLKVDQCIVDALQTKQPFRALRSQFHADYGVFIWIVCTPTGEVYLISYEDGWVGPHWPSTQLCMDPLISTYENKELNITDIEFLECK